MDYLGRNIQYLRKKYGWSQEYLAKQLDVKRNTISNYEVGISRPTFSKLNKLARIFNIPLSDLVEKDLEKENTFWKQKLESAHLAFRQDYYMEEAPPAGKEASDNLNDIESELQDIQFKLSRLRDMLMRLKETQKPTGAESVPEED